MPEESKKNSQKGKNEPKDQRRRRQGRQPAGPVEKKTEKQPERPIEKQSKEPEKPAYEPPGPEFYKNLKRETDEILKITEEANTKYKKKEIQSNWAKYEMPVDSYEDIDEQENMGADYEKLIQAPATVGGHFQFKHEKCWDTESGPSLYDKYFDINMDLLSLAVSTIPFYERNNIEQSIFNENDIANMNHRATKFKYKYYNDNKYITPELETQEKILKKLSSHSNNQNSEIIKDDESLDTNKIDDSDAPSEPTVSIKENSNTIIDLGIVKKEQDYVKENPIPASSPVNELITKVTKQVEEIKFKPDVVNTTIELKDSHEDSKILIDEISGIDEVKKPEIVFLKGESTKEIKMLDVKPPAEKHKVTKEIPKNPVIESPEDLEKWLDDFLDG